MIKIYGMPTCPYCDYIHEQIKGRESEFEYINPIRLNLHEKHIHRFHCLYN